jgi:glycerol uptake facilitator-like aquaporin
LDYICVKTEEPSDENPKILNGFTKFARLAFIFVAHLVAVGVACAFIPEVRKNSKSTLMWPEIKSGTGDNLDGGYIFLEEVVAVCSLLVGFLYLAWLKKYKDEKEPLDKVEPPQVDIEFYIRLTFVVAACKRAFPTAHLSPHVTTYMWGSGQIDGGEWAARFFAGVIASGLVVVWDKVIRHLFSDKSAASEILDLSKDETEKLVEKKEHNWNNFVPMSTPPRPHTAQGTALTP